MKREKGFTLIELLAVIVILAIILLIAIPIILNVVNKSKVAAFELNAKMVLRSLEMNKIINNTIKENEITKEYLDTKLKIDVSNIESVRVALLNNNIAIELIGKNQWGNLVAYGFLQKITVEKLENYDGNFIPPFTITFQPNGKSEYKNNVDIKVLIDSNKTLDETMLKFIWWEEGTLPEISDFKIKFNKDQIINYPENFSGTRQLCIYARDVEGNEIVDCSKKFLIDTEKPVISLIGSEKVVLDLNGNYIELGATAFDKIDGDLTNSIITTNNINASVAGNYNVRYNVKDFAGNEANETVREICVLPDNFQINIATAGTHTVKLPCEAEYIVEIRGAKGGKGGPTGMYAGERVPAGEGSPGYIIIGSMSFKSSDTIRVTIGSVGKDGGIGYNSGGGGGGGGGGGSSTLVVNGSQVVMAAGGKGGQGAKPSYSGGAGTGGVGGTPDGKAGQTPSYGTDPGIGGDGGGSNFTSSSFTRTSLRQGNNDIGRVIITLKK